jgi:hypothetical protein
MEKNKDKRIISIQLSNDEALVLLEWLINFNQTKHPEFFEDQAEERVLFDLEALLEECVPELLEPNYIDSLAKARKAIRDG